MKVLVLGAGGAASNGFARALRLAGGYQLVGANSNPDDLHLSECEDNYRISHSSDYDHWRATLYLLVNKTRPDFVHAQNDAEVENLARFRSAVHLLGAKTYLPDTETIVLCRDKWASYQRWRDHGVTVPETMLADGRGALATMHAAHGELWLRPRTGAGGQKALRTDSVQLAREWLNHHDGWGEFTVAECLTPDTVTVQQLYWDGQLVCSQQRTRVSWANAAGSTTGVSGSTGIGVTSSRREPDRIADLAVKAVDSHPHGLYGIDMAYRKDGVPCPTELNIGRFFTTASEFFAMAGFNMADEYVQCGSGAVNPFPLDLPPNRNPIPDGKKWHRTMDKLPVLA